MENREFFRDEHKKSIFIVGIVSNIHVTFFQRS